MTREDDLLQQLIAEIESARSLESAAQAGEEERKLAELAYSIQNLEHPLMSAETARTQKLAMMKELHRHVRPQPEPVRAPRKPALASGRRMWWAWAGAFAVLACMVVFAAGAGIWLAGPRDAHQAVVMDVNGVVQAASPGADDWTRLENGDVVKEGDRLQTAADSGAALVFFEGSRTVLGEDVDLVLSTLDGGWDKSLHVSFNQISGETHHSVVPLRGEKSFFGVVTPFGQVNVHGTQFGVHVAQDQQAMILVDSGKVQVVQDGTELFLTSGQATAVGKDKSLGKAAYQFSIQGRLTEMAEGQWTAAGVQFAVAPETLMLQDFQLGEPVLARGRILEDGTFVSDRIERPKNDHEKAKFTGVVTEVGVDSWRIGNTTIWLGENTEFEGNAGVGSVVSVNFVVLGDQRWVAKEIEQLDDEDEARTNEDTPTPQGTDTTTPVISPEPSETVWPPETSEPIGEEVYEQYCTGNADHHPDGVKLSEKYNVSYDEIMGWFCQRNGFGEIDLVYSLSLETGVPVEEIFAMRQAGMGWGQIKELLQPKPTKTPKEHPTQKPKSEDPTESPPPESTEVNQPAIPAIPGGPGETAVPAVPANPVKPTKKPK